MLNMLMLENIIQSIILLSCNANPIYYHYQCCAVVAILYGAKGVRFEAPFNYQLLLKNLNRSITGTEKVYYNFAEMETFLVT